MPTKPKIGWFETSEGTDVKIHYYNPHAPYPDYPWTSLLPEGANEYWNNKGQAKFSNHTLVKYITPVWIFHPENVRSAKKRLRQAEACVKAWQTFINDLNKHKKKLED